ncbi:MAG: hypothetical protein IT536_15395 [Hyphomicrobiales bacterium]|nr:hypothetical protein [Hyphomicrobiales bacterium]
MDAAVGPPRQVRVGIASVGNCASSPIQGLNCYRDADGNVPIPGLMNVDFSSYRCADIDAARLALDRSSGGAPIGLSSSSYFMKSPPVRFGDSDAREPTIAFIADGNGRRHSP